MPKLSFSRKRTAGTAKTKPRIAKATGIPTSRSGRQRKFGKALGGCLLPIIGILLFGISAIGFLL